MIYTSTTDYIAGHDIIGHGKTVWVEEKYNFGKEAMEFAFESLIEKAENCDYNAVVGIRHHVREEADGIYVSLLGTFVNVD